MSASPPEEAPHYRGKTLSPESPRPIHISEPSNIPVLEKQIDPVFNLMSTHTDSPNAAAATVPPTQQQEQRPIENGGSQNTNLVETGGGFDGMQKMQESNSTSPKVGNVYAITNSDAVEHGSKQSEPCYNELQATPLDDQISSSDDAHDLSSTPAHVDPAPASSNSPQAEASSKPSPDPHPPSSALSLNIEQTTSFSDEDDVIDVDKNTDEPLKAEGGATGDVVEEGDHLQLLIDSLTQNTTSANPEDKPLQSNDATATVSKPATDSVLENSIVPSTSLPAPIGLPPRPPPQEKPAMHPHYSSTGDIRSFHPTHASHTNNPPNNSQNHPPIASNSYRPTPTFPTPVLPSGAPGNASAAKGFPPPPLGGFQQPPRMQHSQVQQSPTNQQFRSRDGSERNGSGQGNNRPEGGRFSPALERKYEEFLAQERVYVSEGLWDRFPHGSRLFIGNLPTEPATKRELFSIFHKYGALAQISIKQAYGFVQYLETQSCQEALKSEQGFRMRDRNLHLEISKPQKNSRNTGQTGDRDSGRIIPGPSRSPDHGRRPSSRDQGSRFVGDRYVGSGSVMATDFRDPPRRRDDYRPGRSPSPRGFRGRDEYRDSRARSPDRYYGGTRHRSRSPTYNRGPIRYRSPSPRRRDGLGSLSTGLPGPPQRAFKDVPDVQIILLEDLDRAFVSYVEKAFRDRGLRCDVIVSSTQMLPTVLERMILDGVGSVVRISRSSAVSARIPLQVFDYSRGLVNVRFEEYEDLEPHIAAELVVMKLKSTAPPPQPVPPTPSYGSTQYPQQQPPTPTTAQPNIANLITALDGPSLQKLLGAMQQQQQQQPPTPTTPQNPLQHQVMSQNRPTQPIDLAALLANANRFPTNAQLTPQPPPGGYQYPNPPSQIQTHQAQQPQYGYNAPSTVPQPAAQFQGALPYNSGAQSQQNVQDIMDKLKMWKQ